MEIKRGGARLGIEAIQTYTERLGAGQVATDGVVYSAIATVGTTAVEILNQLIDPGFVMRLKQLEVGLTQQFTGLNGSFVGSINFYWEGQSEYHDSAAGVGTLRTGPWMPLIGTLSKGVGTLVTSEDTLSGYLPVGSITHLPARFRLVAVGLRAAVVSGRVKNSSYIRAMGNVIPGV